MSKRILKPEAVLPTTRPRPTEVRRKEQEDEPVDLIKINNELSLLASSRLKLLRRSLAQLREIEWEKRHRDDPEWYVCPVCVGYQNRGHNEEPSCSLAALIADLEAAL